MNLQSLNHRPRLATALQLTLLILVFQGVVATTPTILAGNEMPAVPRSAAAPLVPSSL